MSLMVNDCHAGIVSIDNTFVNGDQYSADYYSRVNRNNVQLEDGINNVTSSQIVDDTLTEADMADEINPRIRTYEGAACEYVYTGLLPVTSATLGTTIGSGTAYPRGFRINKASTTAHTFTASKWTFVDLDSSGNFQYSEQTIGGSTPSVASNSIRLARVSTDTSTVNSVQDLRRTSCANGPFSAIADSTGEANLSNLFSTGVNVRRYSPAGRSPQGWAQGAFVSFDTATTFKVTAGSLYINGKYRYVSSDITVPTTADDPTNGISGLDTGSFTGGPIRWCVYGVADQDGASSYSVSFSQSCNAPTGVTNYRLIGSINSDIGNNFTSFDTVTVHGVSERELAGAWVVFNGAASVLGASDSFNVSGLVDNGSGDYTVTIDSDFNTANYVSIMNGKRSGLTTLLSCMPQTIAAGSARHNCVNQSDAANDGNPVVFLAFGDTRK